MQTADVVADESISPDERERKLEAVDGVHRKLQSLVRSFRMPRHLAFQSPSGAADGSSSMTTTTTMPKLVYNAEMAPVYAYEESMMKLLEELDKIESDGDVEVRKARKARVSAVEAELARLDADKKREWSKQQSQPARPPRSPRRPVGREKHDVVNDSAPARRTASPEQPLQEEESRRRTRAERQVDGAQSSHGRRRSPAKDTFEPQSRAQGSKVRVSRR